MEKRVILAITLSMLVLLFWSHFVVKPTPPQHREIVASPTQPSKALSSEPVINNAKIESSESSQQPLDLSTDKIQLVFNEKQAKINEIFFKDFKNYKFSIKDSFFIQNEPSEYVVSKVNDYEIEFVQSDDYKKINKHFIFTHDKFDFYLDITISNISSSDLHFSPNMLVGYFGSEVNQEAARFQDILVVDAESIKRPSIKKDGLFKDVKFVGLRDRYFCLIVDPEEGDFSSAVKKINARESELGLIFNEIVLKPGLSKSFKFHIYLGPQDLNSLNKINSEWSPIIYYGTFDIISQVLLKLLSLIQGIVRNWGLAIILFSIVIYVILSPLMHKQLKSMKQMQALQPEIEKLRQMHKDNPQKLNKELIELYRVNKTNPFGGCLPLILQIPIFFALYQALMRSVVLKGANFLWIKDLSEPDRLKILPNSLPLIGNEINILPILMAIGMFFQQKLSATSLSGDAAEQQKLMVIIFPIMFGVIFYHMPSGLVLYWFINSALTTLNQMRMMRAK